ncbi:MAG: DUF5053 domain-containing protein [Candidatus Azobacteroides sp.]|nr:DUF5053 domain-containing protein [Candidatus Azobacteroides sp.]
MEQLKKEYDHLLLCGRYISENEFDRKVDEFLLGKTEEEKEYIRQYMLEVFKKNADKIKSISDEIKVIQQLEGVEKYINLAQISESYFGKTKSWLYQRLHAYPVHGKPAQFTPEEKEKLSEALLSLSEKLKNVALKIA